MSRGAGQASDELRESTETALVLAGRYHDEFRRTGDGWRISHRTMDYLWATEPRISSTFLPLLGGLGPGVWRREG